MIEAQDKGVHKVCTLGGEQGGGGVTTSALFYGISSPGAGQFIPYNSACIPAYMGLFWALKWAARLAAK